MTARELIDPNCAHELGLALEEVQYGKDALDSGIPMGDPGEFELYVLGFLKEWFDGARVTIDRPPPARDEAPEGRG